MSRLGWGLLLLGWPTFAAAEVTTHLHSLPTVVIYGTCDGVHVAQSIPLPATSHDGAAFLTLRKVALLQGGTFPTPTAGTFVSAAATTEEGEQIAFTVSGEHYQVYPGDLPTPVRTRPGSSVYLDTVCTGGLGIYAVYATIYYETTH